MTHRRRLRKQSQPQLVHHDGAVYPRHKPDPSWRVNLESLEERCLMTRFVGGTFGDSLVTPEVMTDAQTSECSNQLPADSGNSTLQPSTLKSQAAPLTVGSAMPQLGEVRSIDGTGNNQSNPDWGSAGADLLRIAPADYADAVAVPAGEDRPGAREISNAIADQGLADITSDRDLSAMIYAFGQFLDHDLDLTPNASPAQPFNILVPNGDP